MSKRKNTYPLDEFDSMPGAVKRNGVHRAGVSAWSNIWPYLLVLLLAAGLGFGAVNALMKMPDSKVNKIINDATSSAPQTPKPSDGESDADDEGTPTPDESDAESKPQESETPNEPDETDEPESPDTQEPETPSATVNYSASIRVLNAGAPQGAAGTAATKLKTDGFTAVEATNFEGTKPAATIIYYKGAANKANAERIGELLGITNLSEVSELRADISVVMR